MSLCDRDTQNFTLSRQKDAFEWEGMRRTYLVSGGEWGKDQAVVTFPHDPLSRGQSSSSRIDAERFAGFFYAVISEACSFLLL